MTALRESLAVVEPLGAGAPALQESVAVVEPLGGGEPSLRETLAVVEPLGGGEPSLRCDLVIIEGLTPAPPEPFMATAVFPALKGLTFDIKKAPEFNTALRAATSGRETALAFMPDPWWNFELTYDYLPDLTPGSSGYTDLQTLMGFFLQQQGKFGTWLFQDVDDYHVVAGVIATADGVTATWPFVRNFGGFSEPVGQVDFTVLATFAAIAVNTANSEITIPGHGLETGAGPFFVATDGALPTGIAAGTPYWAIVISASVIRLAASKPLAAAGTYVAITAAGTGPFALTKGFAIYETGPETHTVPASGPYTVTVANAGSFLADGGVTIAGAALTPVTGAPATGQYAVSAGVYTFNAAQEGAAAAITYTWQATASTVSIAMPNQLVFNAGPSSGVVITADFDFFFVCRFLDDKNEWSQFMSKLWELQKIDFRSVIQ